MSEAKRTTLTKKEKKEKKKEGTSHRPTRTFLNNKKTLIRIKGILHNELPETMQLLII